MKKLLFCFLSILIVSQVCAQGKVDFFEGTWQEAFAKAKTENKHVFIDSYTDWCYWCKVMDEETFTDTDIANYLNKEFVVLKVNMEKDFGVDVAMKFRVRSFPTTLYFNPDGELLVKQPGYEADNVKFLNRLKEIRADKSAKVFAFDSQEFGMEYPKFIEGVFGKTGKRKRTDAATVDAWLGSQEDLYGELAWTALTQCPIGDEYTSKVLDNSEKYISMYGPEEFDDFLIGKAIYPMLGKAGAKKDKEMYDSAIALLDKHLNDTESRDQMVSSFELGFLKDSGDWKAYTMMADERLKAKPIEDQLGFANGVAWTLYEKCDDPQCLKMMAEWMDKVVELDPKYMYLDTYAALLYKNGDLKEEKKYAIKAIEIGNNEETDVSETQALLEKIEEGE